MVTRIAPPLARRSTSDTLRTWPIGVARAAARFARVAAYAAALTAVFGFFTVRTVRAEVAERALSIGRDLARYRDLLRGAHRVELNGEPLYVASAVTTQSMGEVLDRFEADCRAHTGGVAEELDALPEASRKVIEKHAPAAWHNRFGVWRENRDKEASIVCIEKRAGNGIADSAHALTKFLATGDVYAIGNLRYVYVRPTEDGRTHVLSTFTEGPFNVYNVIGRADHEPTGTDPANTPRIPGSTRTLSAELDGHMYGTYLFQSSLPVDGALQFYRDSLPQAGWRMLVENQFAGSNVWQRDGVTMVVVATRRDGDAQTNVSFSQARTTPARGGSR